MWFEVFEKLLPLTKKEKKFSIVFLKARNSPINQPLRLWDLRFSLKYISVLMLRDDTLHHLLPLTFFFISSLDYFVFSCLVEKYLWRPWTQDHSFILARANQLRDGRDGPEVPWLRVEGLMRKAAPGSSDPWSICRERGQLEVASPELEGSLVSKVIRTIYYQGPKAYWEFLVCVLISAEQSYAKLQTNLH